MAFFAKKSKRPNIPSKEELISSQIESLEQYIESAPQRLQEEVERERTMMPAPDSLRDREREKVFYHAYSKRQMQNERRFQARNTVLFVLLGSALFAVCWWIYAELHRHGILS